MKTKLVIFDLDGTVVENNYDWAVIRQELGLTGGSILAYLDNLPDPDRWQKYAILEAHERRQTEMARLKSGVREFLEWLASYQIKTALVTNNNRENTCCLLDRFQLRFDLVLTRESGLYKPSGAPLVRAMEQLKATPDETLAIGDTNYDLLAAREAGLTRIFILKSAMTPANLDRVLVVSSFEEIKNYLERV
ncbi:MAG TPA: HAD-IA family hydrolase [Candidatus Saccharicenans sp.]|jgi:HAD superfamily hydrolase (TIGR01509 family)|nr:HAD-IA family hydrolase [Candidatus Saccharicenans sp.]HRD02145.1 HAD-IA family hydrolase [Candidatus Saccharicenans sp.]